MKKLVGLMAVLFFTVAAYANETSKTVKISTSAQCSMCEDRIEKALDKLDGVNKADLDLKTKAVTVDYNEAKVSVDEIKTAISEVGYDADEVKAVKSAYMDLPNCCKKPKKPSGGGC